MAPPSEPTIVVTMEVRGPKASSTISLLVPHRSIATVADRLSGQFDIGEAPAPDAEIGEAVRSAIGAVEVEVRAEVGAVEMTIGDVLALGEGDIVRLGTPESGGEFFCAGGGPVHPPRPGRRGHRRAVQIGRQLGGRSLPPTKRPSPRAL